jgi:hypothetical protein
LAAAARIWADRRLCFTLLLNDALLAVEPPLLAAGFVAADMD